MDPLSKKRVFSQATEPAPTSAFSQVKGTTKSTFSRQQQAHRVTSVSPENYSQEDPVPSPSKAASEEPWSLDIHRDFVEAILEIGIAHASPAIIKEHIISENSELNAERLKSHLQKYRKNRTKSKTEFLGEYDEWMKNVMILGEHGTSETMRKPQNVLHGMKSTRTSEADILGGKSAAFVTYSVMAEEFAEQERDRKQKSVFSENKASTISRPSKKPRPSSPYDAKSFEKSAHDFMNHFVGTTPFDFPKLTKEEEDSPLGIAIAHTRGLVLSMSHQIMSERVERSLQRSNDTVLSDKRASGIELKSSIYQEKVSTSNDRASPPLNANDATSLAISSSFLSSPNIVSTSSLEDSHPPQHLSLHQATGGFFEEHLGNDEQRDIDKIPISYGPPSFFPSKQTSGIGGAFWGHKIQLVDGQGMIPDEVVHPINSNAMEETPLATAITGVGSLEDRVHSFASFGVLEDEHFEQNIGV